MLDVGIVVEMPEKFDASPMRPGEAGVLPSPEKFLVTFFTVNITSLRPTATFMYLSNWAVGSVPKGLEVYALF